MKSFLYLHELFPVLGDNITTSSISHTAMIYAHRNRSNEIDIYVSMLDDVIHDRNTGTRSLFERIIDNTYKVVNHKMSYYEIDNDIYEVVSMLIDEHSESFREPNKVDDATLRRLMELLKNGAVTA